MSQATDSDASLDLDGIVRAWLDEHWDPTLSVEEWWRQVGQAGWSAPHFSPEEGGRGLARSLDMSVEYAKDRLQGGRPIGSFQTIKHKCADLLFGDAAHQHSRLAHRIGL